MPSTEAQQDVRYRVADGAEFHHSQPGHSSQMPIECRTCGARQDLTFFTRDGKAFLECPQEHQQQDWRLHPESVRQGAAHAVDGVVTKMFFPVRTEPQVLPGYEDII
ncbi:hypothetical protein GCM10010211_20310 [Streptomyces albospinus]|uniref:Uncharacterized protein n=1 Tax=Streptomyces albospinus TaxID=285515 RepID=A0ABQ2UVH0_9ACTN|nr:hypothetical protein [Streptomyces albospinus]GGU55503.1 hypothetical protein GCM10010211_20310 [Streptomyces albospinus]